jgi:uncharacterized protein
VAAFRAMWLRDEGIDREQVGGAVTFGAGPGTDWFRDSRTPFVQADAPVWVVYDGAVPVTVSCRVRPELVATFDAVALFAHVDDERWFKFAVERSPAGERLFVSVRTDGVSDDVNHRVAAGVDHHLRLTIDDRSLAAHVELDGRWELLRYAPWPTSPRTRIGLLVQSPRGDGLRATFTDVHVAPTAVAELRDGS